MQPLEFAYHTGITLIPSALTCLCHCDTHALRPMITCPNCAHPNPNEATQCEACYTPLPATRPCPNCNATVTATADFCGQCGYALQQVNVSPVSVPPTVVTQPATENPSSNVETSLPLEAPPTMAVPPNPAASASTAAGSMSPNGVPSVPPMTAMPSGSPLNASKTQLQQPTARLLHLQSNTTLELSSNLDVIHIGKPNDRIPPDIDVSGFTDSDIVSRIHADIRVEGGTFYIEDVGSSNGTYVNNLPLRPGDRHRLRPGDRIALGKGDKVSFLFQM